MIQRTFFTDTEPETETPIARSTDPQTSHNAAVKAELTRSQTQDRCLYCLRKSKVPLCANRLATACCEFFGCEGDDKQKRTQWENYRKRSHEIFRNAKLTEQVGVEMGSRVFRAKELP